MDTLMPNAKGRLAITAAALAGAWCLAAPVASAQAPGLDALAACATKYVAAQAACKALRGANNCWQSAMRAAIDCRRSLSGKSRTNWSAFDACEAVFTRAVRLADCGRAGSLRDCLGPHIRTLTACRRVASGQRAIDWKKFDQCAVVRGRCEVPCGRTSTAAASDCRRKCFERERACERAELD